MQGRDRDEDVENGRVDKEGTGERHTGRLGWTCTQYLLENGQWEPLNRTGSSARAL